MAANLIEDERISLLRPPSASHSVEQLLELVHHHKWYLSRRRRSQFRGKAIERFSRATFKKSYIRDFDEYITCSTALAYQYTELSQNTCRADRTLQAKFIQVNRNRENCRG